MNWSTVGEVFLGAVLAFIFGATLQSWLMNRQEKFQIKMEKMRADEDEKADARRLETEKRIAALHRESMQKIAMENRNHETMLRNRERR